VGGIQNRMESAASDDEDYSIRLQQTLSDNIDVDYAETMVSLNMQSNAFEAALNAGARTIQPSLLDYVG
jgi:flagellar hook-associated protein 3 FlgL